MSQDNSASKNKQDDSKNNVESQLPSTVEVLKSKALNALFTVIRNKETTNEEFVFYCDRLCRILAEEGLAIFSEKNDNSHKITIQTPCGEYNGIQGIANKDLCLVSIVRSGDILLESVRKIVPGAAIGKILLQRVESSKDKHPIHLYTKLPKNISKLKVMLVDPMLATGGSAIGAIKILVKHGVKEENLLFLNVISCPEGLNAIYKHFPNVRIVTAAVDPILNDDKYIVPGLGDFGDRYYRTENVEFEVSNDVSLT